MKQTKVVGGVAAALVLVLLSLATCAKPPESRLAAYGSPRIPPECEQAVYTDPKVRQMIAAGTAVPNYMAEHQNDLAFAKAEAMRKCLIDKGLMKGGVEPVRYQWYPSPF